MSGKKTKQKQDRVAIVCAWRAGEDDLKATLEYAAASAGKRARIYAVEDKTADGPGRTRHRGIMAAEDADVIIIIDAHMRFQGDALVKMARAVKDGGLVCCLTSHNAECAFQPNPYAGARIVYRAKDGATHNALAGKWSKDSKPGDRTCIMGGCYAFRRDWYLSVGQPLAALPGWGCDEEILSICAWISGQPIRCINAHVAHRYRPRPPWQVMSAEYSAVRASRMALIAAVVTDAGQAAELQEWQRRGVPEGVPCVASTEALQVRSALAKFKRTWQDWRVKECEADQIDGVQAGQPIAPPPVKRTSVVTPAKANYGSAENKRVCHVCGSDSSCVTSVRQTGRLIIRYRKCDKCGTRRTTQQVLSTDGQAVDGQNKQEVK